MWHVSLRPFRKLLTGPFMAGYPDGKAAVGLADNGRQEFRMSTDRPLRIDRGGSRIGSGLVRTLGSCGPMATTRYAL
jgi:hypothetical protein